MTWRDGNGRAVAARTIGPIVLEASDQLAKLDRLINAAIAARADASRQDLFASNAGKALVNSAFDLFETNDLYRLGEDVAHELGEDAGT